MEVGKKALRSTYLFSYHLQLTFQAKISLSAPAGHNLQEIAAGTYNTREFNEIMEVLERRLNDSGKNWRHVYKSLIVLDYLIHCGSENIIQYSKENLYVIKTLKEFQYIDDEGRDQGANVRQKVKDVLSLLNDDNRLREERGNGSASHGGRMSSDNRNSKRNSNIPRPAAAGDGYYNEDSDMEKALEESRRTALNDEKKRLESLKSEKELQMVLELSEEEARERRNREASKDQIDFFSPIEQPLNNVNFIQHQQYDQQQQAYQQQMAYQQQQQFLYEQQQLEQQRQQQMLEQKRQQQMMLEQQQRQQQMMMDQQRQQQQLANQQSLVNNPFALPQTQPKVNPFTIPKQTTGEMPMARGNVGDIDPFASISATRNTTVSSNPFGTSSAQPYTPPQKQQQNSMDLLGLDPLTSTNSRIATNNTGGSFNTSFNSAAPSQVGFNNTGGSLNNYPTNNTNAFSGFTATPFSTTSTNSTFSQPSTTFSQPSTTSSFLQQQQQPQVGFNNTGSSFASGGGFNNSGSVPPKNPFGTPTGGAYGYSSGGGQPSLNQLGQGQGNPFGGMGGTGMQTGLSAQQLQQQQQQQQQQQNLFF